MITWFEIPVSDMHRAIAFYEKFLDIRAHLEDLGSFKLAILGGLQGSLVQHEAYRPSHAGVVMYFSARMPIAEQVLLAQHLGAKVLRPPALISEDFGYSAILEDTEGNRIGLHSRH